MKNLSIANRWNVDLIDRYYRQWIEQPQQIDPSWRAFFEGFELGRDKNGQPATDQRARYRVDPAKQARVTGAIYAYRSIGHTIARFNPLLDEPPVNPRLSLERLGFSEEDLDQSYHTGNYLNGVDMTVRELLERLKKTYCGFVGVEYLHIQETKKRRWLQARMEPNSNLSQFSREQTLRIFRKIIEGEAFEQFLHTRYLGQKRFSLEGAETLIACLDAIVQKGPQVGIQKIVMGMAHRGRLNVLANILGKSYEFIFREFSENYLPKMAYGSGDVKYHLGYETTCTTESQQEVAISLVANPSHLEAINSIVEGSTRAEQQLCGPQGRQHIMPLLIHGDAAFAGQGTVTEVFNLSKLTGYRTGGTLHIVANNQIGFTTNPCDARSSRYCTDVAKIVEAPIFHVNGDDPLSVVMVAEWALDYRQTFNEDVVIDMYCYRKHGHNEADEPTFTQPFLYKKIKHHPAISNLFEQQLIRQKVFTPQQAEALKQKFQKTLADAFQNAKAPSPSKTPQRLRKFEGSTAEFQPPYDFKESKTGVARENIEAIAQKLTHVPEIYQINEKIKRLLTAKWNAFQSGEGIDWAFAEALGFGTLLTEEISVRLSGQDSERGTFSQRHAALYDIENQDKCYRPLSHLSEQQAPFYVHNSSLSEAAILGFEFGYSLIHPQTLCLWEAQFGDFANGAQVTIDQFISSSEAKWQRLSGLVMLLPHGYEGQGPEHSSARLERFLQACAEDNIQVCNLTTPAQYYHVLRRQMHRAFRKPLIIMTPKSLLRHKSCTSLVEAFTTGSFQCILDDPEPLPEPNRLILCSGKVYYDLIAYRKAEAITDTAIIRIEQLYPLHVKRLQELLQHYASVAEILWCQEEPENMGAWAYMALQLRHMIDLQCISRPAAASPAVGSLLLHDKQQNELMRAAFSR